MMPLRATPALTISALPTMITMSSLKPENASSSGTTPTASAASRRERRNEIVAQPPPDEGRHHQGDDGEGEQLRQ